MRIFKILISFSILIVCAGCVIPRPPSYVYYDRGYYDDPFYYRVPYAEPSFYKPTLLAPYYSGSPSRFGNQGYVGTYRGGYY